MTGYLRPLIVGPGEGWDVLREERNRLLAASDFTQLVDWPGDAATWREYRQALRDLPANVIDLAQVEWPQQPA